MYNLNKMSVGEIIRQGFETSSLQNTWFVGKLTKEVRIGDTVLGSGDIVAAIITNNMDDDLSLYIAPYSELQNITVHDMDIMACTKKWAYFCEYGLRKIKFKAIRISDIAEVTELLNIDDNKSIKLASAMLEVKDEYNLYTDKLYNIGFYSEAYDDGDGGLVSVGTFVALITALIWLGFECVHTNKTLVRITLALGFGISLICLLYTIILTITVNTRMKPINEEHNTKVRKIINIINGEKPNIEQVAEQVDEELETLQKVNKAFGEPLTLNKKKHRLVSKLIKIS